MSSRFFFFVGSPVRALTSAFFALLTAGLVGPAAVSQLNRDGGFDRFGWNVELGAWRYES